MIYSPSKTEAFDFCSMKGQLMYVDHWEPKEATNATIGKIAGAAFAKGSQATHMGTGPGVDAAVSLFDRTLAHYVACGVSFSMDTSKVKDQLCKALVKYNANNPFAKWKVAATELSLPQYGNCRLDVVGIDQLGIGSIADIKYKRSFNLDPNKVYLQKEVTKYQTSWQFQHYPWAYNDWLVNWTAVDTINKLAPYPLQYCQQMVLVLVIADPFKVLDYTFGVNLNYQKIWLKSAKQKWDDIAAIENGERIPTVAAVHRDAYGQCPMYKACLEQQMDPALMQFDYVQVPRLPEENEGSDGKS